MFILVTKLIVFLNFLRKMMETKLNSEEIPTGLMSSLDITDAEILPFLPYLFKDLWELGSAPGYKYELLKKNMLTSNKPRILDLGCGKGAELIQLRLKFEFEGLGVDIIPEFIEDAKFRCSLNNCKDLTFRVDNYKENLLNFKDFKIVIFSYDSDILGSITESLNSLKDIFPPAKGYILFDNANRKSDKLNELNKRYPSFKETKQFFLEANFQIVGYIFWDMNRLKRDNDFNNNCIATRAKELMDKNPDKMHFLQDFVEKQFDESRLLENELTCVTWLLKNG